MQIPLTNFNNLTCATAPARRNTGSNDVAPCGACRPWIFFINGVLFFLKINSNGMEKEERLLEPPLQVEDESRTRLQP